MFCTQCTNFWHSALLKSTIVEEVTSCQDIKWAPHEITLHRNLRSLRQASESRCRLCRVIYSTPTDHEFNWFLKDEDEPLEVVLSIDPNRGPHPVISAEFRWPDGKSRIGKRMIASCSGLADDEHLATTLRRSAELNTDSTGSEGAFELAKYWVSTCTSGHEKCRPPQSQEATTFVPTRLLDVSDNNIRLIESKTEITTGEDRSFVALSHCWGLIPIIRTLKENYEDHRRGILPEKLSKTFLEAIHATRRLGFRYIWIDSLCIKQDDGNDWASEAATMCDVYQYAVLTIAAAHAPGGDVGCFSERDSLLQLPIVLDLPQNFCSTPTSLVFTTYGRSSDLGGGDPALYGRAWVLQEQLLSPRMLIYDGSQIKWECLTTHGSETSPTSGATRYSLYYKYIRSGIMDKIEYFGSIEANEGTISNHAFWSNLKHQYWCSLVMDYTHRGMTKSKDRLVALTGVGKALSRHTQSKYLAGLWSEHFIEGLLWYIAHNQKFLMSAYQCFDLDTNLTIRHGEEIAPSWSWASVTAPVMYWGQEQPNHDAACEILDVTVSDGIEKQTGAVTIRGHVRRGYVNPVYPYSIREATTSYAHMQSDNPVGTLRTEQINFKDRMFHPNRYFLFSEKTPTTKSKKKSGQAKIEIDIDVSKHGDFKLVRGSFKPDQVLSPTQEITFIALSQQHDGEKPTSGLNTHLPTDPIRVHALALIPTGHAEGEYKRVGLALWEDCAWFGHNCGMKHEQTRIVERPGRWEGPKGRWVKEGWWEKLGRKVWWDDLEMYDVLEKGGHEHGYEVGRLPEMDRYDEAVKISLEVVRIV